jgi:capsular exopolysaccharide synthesis family protein
MRESQGSTSTPRKEAPLPDMTAPSSHEATGNRLTAERALTVLRRRWTLVVLCVVVAGGVAFGVSELQQKEYSASASLLFRNPGFAEDLFSTTPSTASVDPTREAATNEKLVGLKIVGTLAARHLPGLSPKDVSSMVSVSSEGEADVVSVTATSPDPAQAQLVANTFANQFIVFRTKTERAKLLEAKRLAEEEFGRLTLEQQEGPRGQALSRGAEKLGILASLQTGNAELVQPAEQPTSPSSPKPARNTILGVIIGLLLGVGLAFLFEQLNRRLRDPEEARDVFEMPVLGTIPESKAITASNEKGAARELPFMENESFRMLRASLQYFNVDRQIKTVLITSYGASVGKSTVAWNLARVASTSSKVALVETDLRNSSIGQQHGLAMGPGLTQVLTHQVDLDAAIQSKSIGGQSNGNGAAGPTPSLDVIVAGGHPPNPAELIESDALRTLIDQLKERYEFVVIDTAPVGVVADAFPLMREVDGVITVARIGQTTRDHAEHLSEQLRRMDAPLLGFVANGVKVKRGRYGYGYYAGNYGKSTDEPSEKALESSTGARA